MDPVAFATDTVTQQRRLYTREQVAELTNCSLRFVDWCIKDPLTPLRYTHGIGRRRLIAGPVVDEFHRHLQLGS